MKCLTWAMQTGSNPCQTRAGVKTSDRDRSRWKELYGWSAFNRDRSLEHGSGLSDDGIDRVPDSELSLFDPASFMNSIIMANVNMALYRARTLSIYSEMDFLEGFIIPTTNTRHFD